MKFNRKIILALSILLSLSSTYMLWQKVHREKLKGEENRKIVRIVVAGKSILPGDILSSDNLQVLDVPEKGFFPRMLKEEDYPSIEGALSKNNIQEGNPVCWDDIEDPIELNRFSASIENGKRALSVPADENITFAGMLRPGDHVDIYLTLPGGEEMKNKTILLLENIIVTAVDSNFTQNKSDSSEEISITTVTLLVNKTQAASLLNAISVPSKKLGFVLRNPGEKTRKVKRGEKHKTPKTIEMFKMGRLEKTIRVKKDR